MKYELFKIAVNPQSVTLLYNFFTFLQSIFLSCNTKILVNFYYSLINQLHCDIIIANKSLLNFSIFDIAVLAQKLGGGSNAFLPQFYKRLPNHDFVAFLVDAEMLHRFNKNDPYFFIFTSFLDVNRKMSHKSKVNTPYFLVYTRFCDWKWSKNKWTKTSEDQKKFSHQISVVFAH